MHLVENGSVSFFYSWELLKVRSNYFEKKKSL